MFEHSNEFFYHVKIDTQILLIRRTFFSQVYSSTFAHLSSYNRIDGFSFSTKLPIRTTIQMQLSVVRRTAKAATNGAKTFPCLCNKFQIKCRMNHNEEMKKLRETLTADEIDRPEPYDWNSITCAMLLNHHAFIKLFIDEQTHRPITNRSTCFSFNQ